MEKHNMVNYMGLKLVRSKRECTAVQVDAKSVALLDGLNRVNVTREQNVMEFIKCFLPKADVEIERLRIRE